MSSKDILDIETKTIPQTKAKLDGYFKAVVEEVPQLRRGQVWCRQCGRSQKVNSAACMSSGWPKCCGYTMTVDSPDEQTTQEDK